MPSTSSTAKHATTAPPKVNPPGRPKGSRRPGGKATTKPRAARKEGVKVNGRRPGRPKRDIAQTGDWGAANSPFPMRMSDKMIAAVKTEASIANVSMPMVIRVAIEEFLSLPLVERQGKIGVAKARTAPIVRVVKRAIVKLTGTEPRIENIDHPDSLYRRLRKSPDQKYALVCDLHDAVRLDSNQAHAEDVLRKPWLWCKGCKDLMMADPPSSNGQAAMP